MPKIRDKKKGIRRHSRKPTSKDSSAVRDKRNKKMKKRRNSELTSHNVQNLRDVIVSHRCLSRMRHLLSELDISEVGKPVYDTFYIGEMNCWFESASMLSEATEKKLLRFWSENMAMKSCAYDIENMALIMYFATLADRKLARYLSERENMEREVEIKREFGISNGSLSDFQLTKVNEQTISFEYVHGKLIRLMKEYFRDVLYRRPSLDCLQQPLQLKIYGCESLPGIPVDPIDAAVLRQSTSIREALCIVARYALPGYGLRLANEDGSPKSDQDRICADTTTVLLYRLESVDEPSMLRVFRILTNSYRGTPFSSAILSFGISYAADPYEFISISLDETQPDKLNDAQSAIGSFYRMDMFCIPLQISRGRRTVIY